MSKTRPQPSEAVPVDAPARRRLPILLRRAWYGLNQAFRRRIAHLGVTPDQFTVLRTVQEGGAEGLGQSELTRTMASDPNTIASLLERMEAAGLVEREVDRFDRRAHRIRLKKEGREKFLELRDIARELQSEVLKGLPESRRERFLEDLAAVGDACQGAVGDSRRK